MFTEKTKHVKVALIASFEMIAAVAAAVNDSVTGTENRDNKNTKGSWCVYYLELLSRLGEIILIAS